MNSSDAPSLRLRDFAYHARWKSLTVWFLLISTALRLSQLRSMELAPDEAYYWDWSRRLAAGYYDQGPLIAYLIRATTTLFGSTEFGVRIGILLCSLGTILCAGLLALRLFSPLAALLTVLLLGLTPLFEVGSIIATYDPPLVLFWALSALFLERALFTGDRRESNRAWAATGLAAGLGLLSKHSMLFLAPCLALFLLLSPPHRGWLLRPQPYLAGLLMLLCYAGVFWWNAGHHWWTFGHLLFLTHKQNNTPWRRVGDYVGSQALLLGPGLFLATIAACVPPFMAALRRRVAPEIPGEPAPAHDEPAVHASQLPSAHARDLFLACLGLPIAVLFVGMAMKSKVQGNWAVCAWVTPTILFAGLSAERMAGSPAQRRRRSRLLAIIGALSLLPTVILVSPPLRYRLGIRLKPDADLSNTAYGWRQVAARVQEVRARMRREGHPRCFVAGNGYQLPAILAFYLPDHPYTEDMFIHNRLTMYAAYVDNLQSKLGEDAVYVNENMGDDAELRNQFTRVEWEPPLLIFRRPYSAEPIRTIHIARCYGYRRYMGLSLHQGG